MRSSNLIFSGRARGGERRAGGGGRRGAACDPALPGGGVVLAVPAPAAGVLRELGARAYGISFLFNGFNVQSIAMFAAVPLLLGLGQTFVIIAAASISRSASSWAWPR